MSVTAERNKQVCEIRGPYSGNYENTIFWDVAQCTLVGTYQPLPPFSGQIKANGWSKMFVIIYQTTWCNLPEESNLHSK
jgi:hypothetical protein